MEYAADKNGWWFVDKERYLNYKYGTKVDSKKRKARNAEHAKDRPQSSE